MHRAPGSAKDGFTLIEMLAVLAIFALLSALLLPRVGTITGRTLQQSAEELAAQLELARQRAVVTGVRHRLWIDLEGSGYALEWMAPDEEAPEAAPLDVLGRPALSLTPPPQRERFFQPLPGILGRTTWLPESLFFEGLETPEGWIEEGEAAVEFETDGTASATAIHLGDELGRALVLDVLPLADSVRISDEG